MFWERFTTGHKISIVFLMWDAHELHYWLGEKYHNGNTFCLYINGNRARLLRDSSQNECQVRLGCETQSNTSRVGVFTPLSATLSVKNLRKGYPIRRSFPAVVPPHRCDNHCVSFYKNCIQCPTVCSDALFVQVLW